MPAAGDDGGDLDLQARQRRVPPRPLDDEIVRNRLIDVLAERWNVRLITLVAPGGYGKSTTIAQAIRDNDSDPSGIDVYARCGASQLSAIDIANDLLAALDAAQLGPSKSVTVAVEAVTSPVADASPNEVCLPLDDAHLVEQIEGGEELLDGLLVDLPFNGHLVIAGRTMPMIKTSRLRAADDLIELGTDALGFDGEETGQLASRHGVPASAAASAAGWPALSRLALVVGPGVARDYLLEEVVEGLTASQRLGIAAAVVAGSADATVLAESGCSDSVADLLAEVPLLVDLGDGVIGAHDLWQDVLPKIVDEAAVATIVEFVVDRHAAAGRHHEAADAALAAGRWNLAQREIDAATAAGDADITIGLADRWIGAFPDSLRDSMTVRLLGAFRLRLTRDLDGAAAAFESLIDAVQASGDIENETTVCWELAVLCWLRQDSQRMREIQKWSKSIIERGGSRMAAATAGARVSNAELRGDFAGAVRAYQESGADDEVALRHTSSLAMLTGDDATARAVNEQMLRDHPKPIVLGQVRFAEWLCGNPAAILEARSAHAWHLDNHRNDFLVGVYDAMIGASLGEPPHAEAIEQLAWARSRERTFVALIHAARDLIVGDETGAAEAFERRLTEIGLDDPLLRGELLRFLPYSYVLSEAARAWIDGVPELGPLHLRTVELARFFVQLRTDPDTPGECPATDQEILSWMPLPWSIEIAVRLAQRGDRRGVALAEYLSDVCGTTAHVELRRLSRHHLELADGADVILAAVPAPPAAPIHVDTVGGNVVAADGNVEPISRLRVRQVIQILIVRDEVLRGELIEMLWPDIDVAKGRPNLRATLLHLRRLLEPDRQAGEASFHVRQRGERIWIQRSESLTCDLWDAREALEAGHDAAKAGRDEVALEAYQTALTSWSSAGCPDVRDITGVVADLNAVDQAVQRAGCWAGERLLSQGKLDEAAQLGADLLGRDPYDERAHDIVIGAHLASGDVGAARRAIDMCLGRLGELGVQPGSGTWMLIRRYERRTGSAKVTDLRADTA